MLAAFYNINRKITRDELESQCKQNKRQLHRSIWQNESFTCYMVLRNDQSTSMMINLAPQDTAGFSLSYLVAQPNLAGLGRGQTEGVIDSNIPKEIVYDYLKPQTSVIMEVDEIKLIACQVTHKKAVTEQATIPLVDDLKLQVTVQNKSINELTNDLFSLELWQYPHSVAQYYGIERADYFKYEHEMLVKQSLTAYQQAAGDVMIAGIVEEPWHHQTYADYPSLVKWFCQDDQFTFDFADFMTYLKWNLDIGIKGKIKVFSPLPWNNQIAYYNEKQELITEILEVGSTRWYRIWGSFVEALVDCIQRHEIEQEVYLAIDERELKDVLHVIALLEPFRPLLKLSAAIDVNMVGDERLDQIDDISISQSHSTNRSLVTAFIKERSAKGLTTTLYNCTGHFPSLFSRSWNAEGHYILWYFCSLGADGFLRWALDAWTERPLVDSSYWYWESGDCFLVYPHEGNPSASASVYPTFRWQVLNETIIAIKKYRYLLKNDPKKVEAITQFINQLELPLGQPNEYGAMEASDEAQLEELFEVTKRIHEVCKRVLN
ncbi:glycoside hydrolase domain-containing protein [Vagococcus zengguangii]|uniref:DUF4091 domain-containing protein n=1 Tax=Vagococcus zengguangii TaxID=2571750 RepID=A0A4D7CTK1_9ENTE|nr:glycoside hydrolase domain-containing protein [Vagococcus zengguangii]QCI86202.1 DUF4091 domain-containing protein [Vagococcus zengguangii]